MPQLNDYHATDCALNEHHDGPCINDDGLSDYDGPDDHVYPDLNSAADIVDHATRNDGPGFYNHDPIPVDTYAIVRRSDLDKLKLVAFGDKYPGYSTLLVVARTLVDNARTDVARDRPE